MLVVGLVGEKGSGKGTFAELLENGAPAGKRVVRVRFSDLLRETLDLWRIAKTREHLQTLAAIMVKHYGPETLAHATVHRVAEAKADVVLLDGVRWEADRLLIRSFEHNLLVYITASPRIRYERLRGRSENAKEGQTTYEQFLKEEHAVTEHAIPAIGATADIRIVNEGSRDELRRYINAVIDRVAAIA